MKSTSYVTNAINPASPSRLGEFVLRLREFATRALPIILPLLLTLSPSHSAFALPGIYGTIIDGADQQPLPSATVTLRRTADSTLVAGAISDADGTFSIEEVPGGDYYLTAGFIGYQSHIAAIRLTGNADYHTGPLILQQQSIAVGEAVIVVERIRGKSDGQAITWFVNQRMEAASNSGLDLLQHIPGVQVDIMQNLSIQGSRRITLKVNGVERDVAYLRQVKASSIERIEMDLSPGAGTNAETDGVLNIVLKAPNIGVGGHVYLEAPLSANEYYLFPNYNLDAGFGKWQLFTSYDAEISGFDIVERSRHTLPDTDGNVHFTSSQSVRQDYLSHRFHFGADYTPNAQHQFSFYAYSNPFSNEHSGTVQSESRTNRQMPTAWKGSKTDHDQNRRTFYSLYYKYRMDEGKEWSVDASWYRLKGDNSTRYDYSLPLDAPSVLVAVKPFQQTFRARTDYQTPLMDKWTLKSGISAEHQEMEDRQSAAFNHREQVMGAYVQIGGATGEVQLSGGVRAEYWSTRLAASARQEAVGLFPHASVQWSVNPRHRLAIAFRRSVQRPNIYQLNPYVTTLDAHSTMAGNTALRPSVRAQVHIDHNITFASNHAGFQVFFAQNSDVIGPVTLIADGKMESQYQNAGDLRQWGFQLTGGLNWFKRVSFSPYVKVYHSQDRGQVLPNSHRLRPQSSWGCDASLSTILTISKTTVAALMFQYRSAQTTFQNTYFSDALYFVSVDKTIGQNWKVGIKSALPFAGAFVYRGHEVESRANSLPTNPGNPGGDFSSKSSGTIYLSDLPLWLHVRYQFGGGRVGRVDGVSRGERGNRVEKEERGGKGF